MICRFLMLIENVIEVKLFIVVETIKVIKKITIIFKFLSNMKKSIVLITKTIMCNELIIF